LCPGGGRCIHRPGIAKHKKAPPGFPDGAFWVAPAYSPLALRARDQISV
jgi:type IV secretory pathway VirB3-like protein